ncbi:hypothetical protein ACHQM5_022496 [Ranunculus cassubicifolius]
MPTFTSVTLDRFLEPGEGKSPKRTMPTIDKKIQFSDTSFSFPPTPHTINQKRNETPFFKNFSQGDASVQQEVTEKLEIQNRNMNGKDVLLTAPVLSPNADVVKTYEKFAGFHNGKLQNNNMHVNVDFSESELQSEDFYDPRESMSVSNETDDNTGNYCNFKVSTPMAVFYDAPDDLSECGSQSCSSLRDVESELRERRLSWLMEMESRNQAEETVEILKRQWERLAQKLADEGLTLPSASTIFAEDEKSEGFDPAEQLCEQIRLARAVSVSVGRAEAKAEADLELESKIESKNFEIQRLLQRLNYYETVNGEMSLRNQEATEMARRLKQRRKRKQRWIWGTVGASVVLGSMALAAWSYLPSSSESAPIDSLHAPDAESAPDGLTN